MRKKVLTKEIVMPDEIIKQKIFLIRGKKVMFNRDLAILYGVETKILNRAVKRNIKRFPEDFMFKLNKQETEIWKYQILGITENSRCQNGTLSLRSQIATLNNQNSRSQLVTLKHGQNIKYVPLVFTEQGVAMLSSVLKSERAIEVNIQIMRTFTKMREFLTNHEELRKKIEKLEEQYDKHNQKFKIVFRVIHLFLKEESKPKTQIGFRGK